MRELIEKSFLGAALVFMINHTLGHLVLFFPVGFADGAMLVEGTFFGMMFNFRLYGWFILANGLFFLLVKRFFPKWRMTANVLLFFILFNLILKRNPLGDEGELFYYFRYLVALSSLLLVNKINERMSWKGRTAMIISPFLFTAFIIFLFSNSW